MASALLARCRPGTTAPARASTPRRRGSATRARASSRNKNSNASTRGAHTALTAIASIASLLRRRASGGGAAVADAPAEVADPTRTRGEPLPILPDAPSRASDSAKLRTASGAPVQFLGISSEAFARERGEDALDVPARARASGVNYVHVSHKSLERGADLRGLRKLVGDDPVKRKKLFVTLGMSAKTLREIIAAEKKSAEKKKSGEKKSGGDGDGDGKGKGGVLGGVLEGGGAIYGNGSTERAITTHVERCLGALNTSYVDAFFFEDVERGDEVDVVASLRWMRRSLLVVPDKGRAGIDGVVRFVGAGTRDRCVGVRMLRCDKADVGGFGADVAYDYDAAAKASREEGARDTAAADSGAFYTLVPIRPRWRGERRSLRTFAGVSLRPPLAFNTRPRRLSTPTDAFQLHPDIRLYRTALILLHRPRDAAALRAGFPRRAVRHDARRRGAVDVPGGAHSRRPRDRDAVQRARASRGGGGERVDAV